MTATSPVRVVGVHGVGHYNRRQTPDEVRTAQAQDWTKHLAVGLTADPALIDLDFAYYAPLLHPGPVSQGDGDLEELADPLERELMAAWLDALDAPQAVSQGALTLPLRYAASWVAERLSLDGRLTKLFIRVFFREMAAYVRADDAVERLAAREEIARRIARHRPRIVIAHSLGSVVTYEALHAHPELRLELLVTAGSPLALPRAVFDRLSPRPENGPRHRLGTRPPGVERWVNIADPGDPVAIPPRLATFFQGVALDLTDTIHAGFGFHHAKNYLACAAMSALLGPYVGR
ncbi:serine peptidase [Streptomyces sp. NPDC004546]|uniref:serine peptidase n=1 Tax=Streptomyces sp. NPDC004546 TaxID=3154282 RepID=UPI0033A1AE69